MRCAVGVAVVVLAFPGMAGAVTTSSFDSNNGTLTVAMTGTSAATSVGCSATTHDVTVGGADPGTGPLVCSTVDAIAVTGDAGQDSVSLAGISSANFASLTSVTANLGGGNDNYFASAIGDTVNMGAADNSGGDVVTTGSGNDHVTCAGGCQLTENLTGSTTLTDTASSDGGGQGGVDSLSGVTALTTVTTGSNVSVDASAATMPIVFDGYGNSSGQVFRGGSANDDFDISAGSASIYGGGGANSLTIAPGTDGKVTLTPTSLTSSVSAALQNIQSATIAGGSGDNVYDWSTFTGPVVLSDTSGHDTVTAGAGNDSITLFGGSGSVNAGGGNDQISLSGNPTADYSVDGGSGSNRLSWVQTAPGTTTVTNTALSTPDGPITLANIGALTLNGTNGDDVFDARGFSGPVTIAGEGGQDVMLGGAGADNLTGFADSTDCFNGGPGADTIDGGGSTSDTDVVDPADTPVSGSTYTPVSTCGYGDAAPTAGGGFGYTDHTPPTVSAKIAAWGAQIPGGIYGGYVTVVGTASDPSPSSGTPTLRCSLDPATPPASYDDFGAGACTQATTAAGPHIFYVAARDPAGNTSTVASVSFRIVAVPDTSITSGPAGNTWTSEPSYTFASTIPGSTFMCSVDGGPYTACGAALAIGPFTAGTTHSLAVQATSPDGITDPTPAVVNVHVNATQVSTDRCEITPFLAYGEDDSEADLDSCGLYFGTGSDHSCPYQQKCLFPPDTCPALAKCTMTTTAIWTEGDINVPWVVQANTDIGGPLGAADGRYSHECTVANGQHGCTESDTESLLGPADFDGFCFPYADIGNGAQFLDAADRDLVCTTTITTTPAQPLLSVTLNSGILIFAPSAGAFVFTPATKASHALSAQVRKKKKKREAPLFKPTQKSVSASGAVSFNPQLSAAAKASLKLHHKLALTIAVKFVPSASGTPLTRTIRTTLTVAARKPRTCPKHRPKGHLKKPVVCLPAGAPKTSRR